MASFLRAPCVSPAIMIPPTPKEVNREDSSGGVYVYKPVIFAGGYIDAWPAGLVGGWLGPRRKKSLWAAESGLTGSAIRV